MKKKNKYTSKITILILLFLLIASTIIYYQLKYISDKKNIKNDKMSYIIDCNDSDIPDSVKISPTTILDDKNDVHLAYARLAGLKQVYISNMEFEQDSANAVNNKLLTKIKSNPSYYVNKLDHSYPYVIPAMGDLLNEIAFRFKKNLPKDKKEEFRFVVTSALRTNETQQNLSKYNRNASPTSAHLFGGTVDISYKVFFSTKQDTLVQDWEALQALIKTMEELRKKCRFVSVKERRQSCFHTTVVVCKN